MLNKKCYISLRNKVNEIIANFEFTCINIQITKISDKELCRSGEFVHLKSLADQMSLFYSEEVW